MTFTCSVVRLPSGAGHDAKVFRDVLLHGHAVRPGPRTAATTCANTPRLADIGRAAEALHAFLKTAAEM